MASAIGVRPLDMAMVYERNTSGSRPLEYAVTDVSDDEPLRADLWEITEEGRALVEPHAGVARAPYDRDIGSEGGGRDAGFWVLVVIAVVTGVCAAYTLLTVTGVLGGG